MTFSNPTGYKIKGVNESYEITSIIYLINALKKGILNTSINKLTQSLSHKLLSESGAALHMMMHVEPKLCWINGNEEFCCCMVNRS